MSVTEIATLRLVPPHTWSSPATRSFFAAAASQQAARSGCPLHYFQDTADAAIVYILTGWESVAAHEAWIASEANQKLLERGTGLIEVVGLQHARFAVELEGIDVVILERWEESGGGVEQERGAIVDVSGVVEEAPGHCYRLRGFAETQERGGEAGKLGEGTTFLRRMSVHDDDGVAA
ncbi:hypothetical protein TRAPUB_425 [Trametes pubescens]|uniref:ABM domain-containing protein n=1 Tax=Trametes pubescens TaxID=154538 RepID=A0A1M2VM72_TRAPU|nr:hypothetical protein TRAPUB_425 [Trametes pubescens]